MKYGSLLRGLLVLTALACKQEGVKPQIDIDPNTQDGADGDGDGDGVTIAQGDCNDADAQTYPGAVEICDGIDNNCNGQSDEGLEKVWYQDADADGFGDINVYTTACEAPDNYIENGEDCDDTMGSVHPGAQELCTDLVDLNCDGVSGTDADGDGHAACDDCNDNDAEISPSAMEICDDNNVDEDCDGLINDEDPSIDASTQIAFWSDADGDGYGEDLTLSLSCIPQGALQGGDCNDADAAFYPGAPETDCADANDYNCDGYSGAIDNDGDGYFACQECNDGDVAIHPNIDESCNGIDDNCDGQVDEGITVAWYPDSDGDGYGQNTASIWDCVQPTGYVNDATDCNDVDATIYPSAGEVCDGVDEDCDGVIDNNASDAILLYADVDNDTYGDPNQDIYACAGSAGVSANSDDCDDTSATINPAMTEICDGLDNDCDGLIDAGVNVGDVWYLDSDGDGYGDSSMTLLSCVQPGGYVRYDGDCNDADAAFYPNAPETDCTDPNDYNCDGSTGMSDNDGDGYVACTDCNDQDVAIYPGATEICNGQDDNCNNGIDESGAIGEVPWYYDGDGDGYGDNTASINACNQPLGYVSDDTDCDDAHATIYPGASEHCDGSDENCDGQIDENAIDMVTWYIDADQDGFGDINVSQMACVAPTGYLANADDCDDTETSINPFSLEYCDGIDNDCDGVTDNNVVDPLDWYVDNDGDGYGTGQPLSACGPLTSYATANGDCDDSDVLYHPNANELCTDTNDYNCDGSIGSADADNDGYMACEECDDSNAAINPAATEACNGYDDNCDGRTDEAGATGEQIWYEDMDADGHGSSTIMYACNQPYGYVSNSTDCDDSRASVNPDAMEACNGYDDDCDTYIDEAGSIGETLWYIDADGDGYGDPNTVLSACTQPVGYISVAGDCNDGDTGINPSALDICDVVDNDCDGSFDEGGYCPCPVLTFNGHPYQFCTSGVDWNSAEVACEVSSGYKLVVPTDSAENTWASSTALSYSGSRWWAGGYDSVIEGRWQWITNETWSWSNFAAGEGSSNSQDCLQLGNIDYTWTDASCHSSGNYICEGMP